jgi:hypothetical protein
MDHLMGRVEAIARETGHVEGEEDGGAISDEKDEFLQLKHQIGTEIRELRNSIKDRDRFANSSGSEKNKPEIIRMSTEIKQQIKVLREKAQDLRGLLERKLKDLEKKGKETS